MGCFESINMDQTFAGVTPLLVDEEEDWLLLVQGSLDGIVPFYPVDVVSEAWKTLNEFILITRQTCARYLMNVLPHWPEILSRCTWKRSGSIALFRTVSMELILPCLSQTGPVYDSVTLPSPHAFA